MMAPRRPTRFAGDAVGVAPTLVSLFAGAGGLDVGLERAGFRTVAAVERDDRCAETLVAARAARLSIPHSGGRTFLGDAAILHAPIESLSGADFGLAGPPDLLAGGPPCQPFSSAGNRGSLHDPRGRLFEEFVRIADELRPRFVLFENVRGLVTARGEGGDHGGAIAMVRNAFGAIGYGTRCALLDAADYGCPQRRVRCFLIGASRGDLPDFPAPADEPGTHVSLGAFLASRGDPPDADVVRPTARLAGLLAGVRGGSGLRSAGAKEATRPGGHWGYRQGAFVADLSRPARTVTGSASQDWIRLADGTLRRLTAGECAALQGFPEGWPFSGGISSRFRQIGNAVPAAFGEAVGAVLVAAVAAIAESGGGDRGGPPPSAPLPAAFLRAAANARREESRNGASRAAARRARGGEGGDTR